MNYSNISGVTYNVSRLEVTVTFDPQAEDQVLSLYRMIKPLVDKIIKRGEDYRKSLEKKDKAEKARRKRMQANRKRARERRKLAKSKKK